MEIKKSTPSDLLREYRVVFTKDVQEVKCYVKAIAICTDCERRIEFLAGYDEAVYHECNRGNVVSYPKL